MLIFLLLKKKIIFLKSNKLIKERKVTKYINIDSILPKKEKMKTEKKI